ncbi:AraC family transcriptional regulator [Marinomonas algicola]|uniref:AraC family transcriptional regulator n=1 Tax=Marinomonas algicola TaxID=2773454 RepID=UPI00174D64E6|nr:AraC family transcriptional regulator [Marinomonas algicola]
MLLPQIELETHCSSAKYAKQWMDDICGPHALDIWGSKPLDFHHKGHRLPKLGIVAGSLSYGSNVTIGVDSDNSLKGYSISLPLHGYQKLRSAGSEFYSNENNGLIVSPTSQQELEINDKCEKLQLLIPSKAMTSVAERLIKEPINDSVQFDPEMDLMRPEMKAWWCMSQKIVEDWGCISALYSQPTMIDHLESMIIEGLLLSQPNNISQKIQHAEHPFSPSIPAYLLRSCHWMKKNAQSKVTVDDVAAHAGVSKFTLFAGFREHLQTSPLEWLKHHRMQQVRYALMQSNSRTKVSSVAMEWGFNHFGRFSQQYQQAFGELPSETLVKSRP